MINAFRHQRFLHQQQPASAIDAVMRVINAFRHQRFLHTSPEAQLPGQKSVINAFRHQRFLHASSSFHPCRFTWSDQRLSASKIFAQRRSRTTRLRFSGDQRLSASKIFAPACALSSVETIPAVINAFRHQRFLHLLLHIAATTAGE